MTNLWIRSWKYFWDWNWGADKKCLSLSYHLLLHTQLLPSTERGASESVIPVLDHGQKGCRNQSQPPPLHHCACVWPELEIVGLSFSVSYLSMKGFRMVIPNKKNIRTEKPIIVNPSSMARSSPALDGSLLCSSGGSPPLWSVFLFLPEVEMAVLWRKWGRDSSKEVGTFTNPWGVRDDPICSSLRVVSRSHAIQWDPMFRTLWKVYRNMLKWCVINFFLECNKQN